MQLLKYQLLILATLMTVPSFANQLPLPADRPDQTQRNEEVKKSAPEPKKTETPPSPIIKEDAAGYAACLGLLREQGTEFKPVNPIDDENGCGIEKPIEVNQILPGIELKPKAIVRCQVALELSRWLTQSVIPAANIAFGAQNNLVTVNQASSYVCRKRNNAKIGKLSEHAKGNAIDIAGFTFAKGKPFIVEPRAKDSTLTGAFQRTIAKSACLHFTTVLDPQSDAAHHTHIHMDLAERRGGYRYCW